MVLKSMLDEIRKRDLPIDLLVCSSTLNPETTSSCFPGVRVLPALLSAAAPENSQCSGDTQHLQERGIRPWMCSTEGPMGLIALYLKYAYTVPAYF
jgi:hypothetical protein